MLLHQATRKVKKLVPALVLCCLAYLNYSSCYVIVYQEYYLRYRRVAALVSWVMMGLLQMSLFIYWAAIFRLGCGSYPKFPTFDLYGLNDPASSKVPYAFPCDEQGYPFWCTRCRNLKPNRTFHSTDVDKCVPKFDHYCMWIGTAIGRDNYLAFIKFLQMFGGYLVIILTLTAASKITVLRRNPSKLPHYIATFILVSFMMSMVCTLYAMVFLNMAVNILTIDEMAAKDARVYRRYTEKESIKSDRPWWCTGKVPRVETGKRFINISHHDTRVVVPIHVKDRPFSLGFKRNLVNIVLNGNINDNFSTRPFSTALFIKALFVCFFPFVDIIYSRRVQAKIPATYEGCTDQFTPAFIDFLKMKIANGKFEHVSYVHKSNSLARTEEYTE